MKRKTFKRHMNRCEALFDEWIPLLLPGFKVRVRYHGTRDSFESEGGARDGDMCVVPYWPYMLGQVHVCVPAVRALSDARLEYSVVHELVHILLHEAVGNPTDENRRGHIERVTTMTARAILRARDEGGGPCSG
jgi:hypothetical protein